jgi:leucyl aminopeptidase
MEVTFLETAQIESADLVIVIASKSGGSDFVKSKLKHLMCEEAIETAFLSGGDALTYGKIGKINVVSKTGKLVEIIVAGAGERGTTTMVGAEKLGGHIYDHVAAKDATVCLYNDIESELPQAAAYIVSGIELKSWHFDKYKSKKNDRKIKNMCVQTNYAMINREAMASLAPIRDAVFLAREMVTEPANVMNSDKILEIALSLKKVGVKVSFLEQKEMEKLGMNAILGVGKGSDNPTYLIVMEYCADKTKSKIALVGKGLTFDSGGISIKPANKMGEMKGDMAGAAVVVGTMKALAEQKSKVNVVGVIGVTENMLSGSAQRPGDVVVSMSGKTIEVDNTDAEGRLVLADAIYYTATNYNPRIVITFATLTGAIQVALGHEFAGLFSDSDELAVAMTEAGTLVGEKVWRMPLHQSYADDIKSDVADVKNVGSGRGAGSTTAALFLKEFVPVKTEDGTIKFAHVDIAATEWDSKNRALSQKGATGFGVRLACAFIAAQCAKAQNEEFVK